MALYTKLVRNEQVNMSIYYLLELGIVDIKKHQQSRKR